ncbi:MAG: cupin domain-containing protein [Acidimicrobiia bacterium]
MEKKNAGSPDETRKFDKGQLEVSTLSGVVWGRATFEPGWKWSECVKPIAGTDLCEVHHNGYVVSGRLHIRMDDGEETEIGPGDLFVCPPGHDAWTLGNEACVLYDFSSDISKYAK